MASERVHEWRCGMCGHWSPRRCRARCQRCGAERGYGYREGEAVEEREVEGEERLEDVLRDDERLRQMLGGIMEVVRQCDEQLDEHGLCQCARYIGQILQRAAEIGTALRRYVEAPEAHICDGGDCGLEPCAETPAHREPGHARTVRPPRAARRGEGGGK